MGFKKAFKKAKKTTKKTYNDAESKSSPIVKEVANETQPIFENVAEKSTPVSNPVVDVSHTSIEVVKEELVPEPDSNQAPSDPSPESEVIIEQPNRGFIDEDEDEPVYEDMHTIDENEAFENAQIDKLIYAQKNRELEAQRERERRKRKRKKKDNLADWQTTLIASCAVIAGFFFMKPK